MDVEPTTGAPEPAPPPVVRHRVGLSSTGVFLLNVAIQAIGFGANYFLYRYIAHDPTGTALVGTVQLYLLIGSTVNSIGDLRIGTSYTFFVARGHPARESTATYLLLRLAMVGAAGVALFFIGTIPGTGLSFASTTEEYEGLALFMGLPILWSIQTVYTQLQVARGRSTAGQIPIFLETAIRSPLLILAVFEWPTLTGLTLAYLPGALASAGLSFRTVARELQRFRRSEAMKLFRYAWPLMGSLFLLYLANNTPPFIVNAYLGTIGLTWFNFANAWRILALTVPAAVSMPLFPYLAGLHRRRSFEAVREGTWKALRYTAMIVFPGSMMMIIYRVNLINTFSNGTFVQPDMVPLALLAASVIPASLSQLIGTSLNAVGFQRLELYLTGLQVGVLFTSAVLLLPPFGLFGLTGLEAVAAAMLASATAALILNTYFMGRILAVRIQLKPVAAILGSAAVSFYAVSQLNMFVAVGRYYGLAFGIVVGFLVYFLVLSLVGELTRQDVRYLCGAIALPAWVGAGVARVCWREAGNPVPYAVAGASGGLFEQATIPGETPDEPPGRPPPPLR